MEESIVSSWLFCSLARLGRLSMGPRPVKVDAAEASKKSLL